MKVCREEMHEEYAKVAIQQMPTDAEIERIASAFKIISEPSRLKIMLALKGGELCVYHIVSAVGGMQSAVSHQLRILRDHGILKSRRVGQNIHYSLADEHVVKLLDMACEHLKCN